MPIGQHIRFEVEDAILKGLTEIGQSWAVDLPRRISSADDCRLIPGGFTYASNPEIPRPGPLMGGFFVRFAPHYPVVFRWDTVWLQFATGR